MLPKYGAFQQTSREKSHLPGGKTDKRLQTDKVKPALLTVQPAQHTPHMPDDAQNGNSKP